MGPGGGGDVSVDVAFGGYDSIRRLSFLRYPKFPFFPDIFFGFLKKSKKMSVAEKVKRQFFFYSKLQDKVGKRLKNMFQQLENFFKFFFQKKNFETKPPKKKKKKKKKKK